MTLTKQQLLRAAARHARELAMECAEGRAPIFGSAIEVDEDGVPRCPMGHIAVRAGMKERYPHSPLNMALGEKGNGLWWEIVSINDYSKSQDERCRLLPLPLLFLGDELELAAKALP